MTQAVVSEVVSKALDVVMGTTGLSWGLKNRLLREMNRTLRMHACQILATDDLAGYLAEEFNSILTEEDLRPQLRISLASLFAQEIYAWLNGDFDTDNAAD